MKKCTAAIWEVRTSMQQGVYKNIALKFTSSFSWNVMPCSEQAWAWQNWWVCHQSCELN